MIRAVICDLYSTVLEVLPPPADAAEKWIQLWQAHWNRNPRLTLSQVDEACRQEVAKQHAAARALGIDYPEVYWPAVLAAVLPELWQLDSAAEREDFAQAHAALNRSVGLMAQAGPLLAELSNSGIKLGVASNAQPYTLRDLNDCLKSQRLDRSIFDPDLCFFSYRAGFSKPDPRVFRWLRLRLTAMEIAPEETLMVGDRLENDIRPAQAQGWQVWQLRANRSSTSPLPEGNWLELRNWLLKKSLPEATGGD